MADIIDLSNDVRTAFEVIKSKRLPYSELHNYYTGAHPLRYSTDKLRDVFSKTLNVYFAENWLAVIIDAVLDRLVLNGFDISNNEEAKKKMDDLWRDFNLSLLADDVHESCTLVSEAFVIAMKVEDEETGDETLDIFFNDARLCHMFYDPSRPNQKRMAAKMWQDEEGYARLTLYYPDRFEYYRSRAVLKSGSTVSTFKHWIPDPDLPEEENPFGVIPVFHWTTSRTTRKRDLGPSEISMQDAINKLLTDMMVSSEFNSFTQRIIISQADPGNMPNTPNSNWWLPASDEGQGTQVIELGGRNLSGFFEGIDKLATSLAIISRTPKHYFFSQGGDPSGEALIALEAPLNKKVKKRQSRYNVEWQSFVQFLLSLEGIDVKKNEIVSLWEPAETIQPMTQSTIISTLVSSGVPLITALRRQGWSNNDIKQLTEDVMQSVNDKNKLQAVLTFYQAAQAAVSAGVPIETFLLENGWDNSKLSNMGTQKAAQILNDQEDVIPEVEQ